jgi:hypothetical protein
MFYLIFYSNNKVETENPTSACNSLIELTYKMDKKLKSYLTN